MCIVIESKIFLHLYQGKYKHASRLIYVLFFGIIPLFSSSLFMFMLMVKRLTEDLHVATSSAKRVITVGK